jgi:hypothetical protein
MAAPPQPEQPFDLDRRVEVPLPGAAAPVLASRGAR